MIIWRGWGYLTLLIPILLWLAIVVTISSLGDYYEPDSLKAAAFVYRSMAGGFIAGALILWPLVRYRNRTAPGVDELAFIPMRYWTPVVAFFGAAAFVASFIPAALTAF